MDRSISILASESVALLKEMIAIQSPSFEEEKVCSHICGWMSDKGVTHERVGNNIIASHITDESRPTLMLCAHIDTVSASPDYSFDPYFPDYQNAAEVISTIRGKKYEASDIVAGLGSNDDGASAVAMIAVYRYLCAADRQGERGIQNNPSHFVGPSPCGQGGSTVFLHTPSAEHQIATPEADFCFWIFGVDAFHKVGTVKVAGCFSCYDVVSHRSLIC